MRNLAASPPPPTAAEKTPAERADDEKLLWRPETVAHKLDIGVGTLYRWRNSGIFPKWDLRYGPKIMMWKRETVLQWIADNQGKWIDKPKGMEGAQ